MRRSAGGFIVAVLVLAAWGCGGGGDSSPTTTAIPLSSTFRLLQTGDTWAYSVTGSSATGASSFNFTGTLNATVTNTIFNGAAVMAQNQALQVVATGQTFAFNNSLFFTQDPATRNVTEYGQQEGNEISTLTAPRTALPGQWSAGYAVDDQVSYTNGQTERRTTTIVGSEVVQVPAGQFTAWRVLRSVTDANSSTNGTYWYAPQIGNYVKGEETSTDLGAGQTTTRRVELTSTNVPLQ